MARMKKNVGDNVSGKLFNVVFYEMYGKNYVRAAPVTTPDTWNEEQIMRRKRISMVSSLWRALRSEQFSAIWNSASQQMNGYAWFVKANMPAIQIDGTLIDPRLLKMSDGKLPVVQNLVVERVENDPSAIRVSWQNDPHTRGERLNDELMAITWADGKFSQIMATGLKRSQGNGMLMLPANPVNASHVFLFMASADRKMYSESTGLQI